MDRIRIVTSSLLLVLLCRSNFFVVDVAVARGGTATNETCFWSAWAATQAAGHTCVAKKL
jgi:hypothetical protein